MDTTFTFDYLTRLPKMCTSCGRVLNEDDIFSSLESGENYTEMLLRMKLKICCSMTIISSVAYQRKKRELTSSNQLAQQFEENLLRGKQTIFTFATDTFDYSKYDKPVEDDLPDVNNDDLAENDGEDDYGEDNEYDGGDDNEEIYE